MARVSRFSEIFSADAHPARPRPQQPCPCHYQKTGKKPTTATTTLTSFVTKPYRGVRALARCYKQHLDLIIATNNMPSPSQTDHPDAVEAGSTAYGLRAASDEELRRQSERNHLDYMFYLGPDAYNNITPRTTTTSTTSTTTTTATDNPCVHDVRASWDKAYMCPSDAASAVHRIDEACNEYFSALGAMPVMITITEEEEEEEEEEEKDY